MTHVQWDTGEVNSQNISRVQTEIHLSLDNNKRFECHHALFCLDNEKKLLFSNQTELVKTYHINRFAP